MEMYALPSTKFRSPVARSARMPRPALEQALARAAQCSRVVLVRAPAGFGKTAALAAMLGHLPPGTATAWISLDTHDDAPRLFAGLAAALDPLDPPWRAAPEALASLVDAAAPGAGRPLAELVNALAGMDAAHGVIVLDDLHRVSEGGALALLDSLIERLPSHWSLVLSSRTEPPLALARWRAADELADFGQEQLRFTEHEAAQLAGHEERPPSSEWLAALHRRTQGWPAGLRLGLAASRGRRGDPDALPRVERDLFDYFASEVLDDMPPALRDFLLRCSVLPRLSAGRAAAVSADLHAAWHLEEIERRGLFVAAIDGPERTLVLHDLFRDALSDRLHKQYPGELPGLLQRAAAGERDPLLRTDWLLRAGDEAAAEEALAGAADDLLLTGRLAELQRAIGSFSSAWAGHSARLLRLQASGEGLRWRWADMAQRLEAAQQVARSAGDPAQWQLAQAQRAVALDELGRGEECDRLLATLHALPLAPQARAFALHAGCSRHFLKGELDQVPLRFAELLEQLERSDSLLLWWQCAPGTAWSTLRGMRRLLERYVSGALRRCGERELPLRATLRLLQAHALLWSGRIEEAVAQGELAEADGRWLACSADSEVTIAVFRLLVAAMRGREDEVGTGLAALFEREDQTRDPDRARQWHHLVGMLGVRLNDTLGSGPGALAAWAGHLTGRPLAADAPPLGRPSAVLARHAAAGGHLALAAERFAAVLPHAWRMDEMGQFVELSLRSAQAWILCGDVPAAAEAARPALQRMQSEGERGHALMCGPQVLATLAQAPWGGSLAPDLQDELQAAADLAARLHHRPPLPPVPAASSGVPTALVPPASPLPQLSVREREVLERVAAGDSNKHIARLLDISLHTVKRHMANILDKLGLESRLQAGLWLKEHGG